MDRGIWCWLLECTQNNDVSAHWTMSGQTFRLWMSQEICRVQWDADLKTHWTRPFVILLRGHIIAITPPPPIKEKLIAPFPMPMIARYVPMEDTARQIMSMMTMQHVSELRRANLFSSERDGWDAFMKQSAVQELKNLMIDSFLCDTMMLINTSIDPTSNCRRANQAGNYYVRTWC